ncbi:hypothetical protein [Nostoc sphaeroides]|uniref:Uncharacterized protein n=1 Tax=Nostoc sphaeroides CCNUC1 TaxID=2653204 RepID=A0A5P8VZM7_9NOSO|nr:hypothetical protein [Nostoc sphaeroides]QFS45870.1 hypothetical protein GXM_03349 [Nostoc sphaeroides CCNUC1]
MSYSQFDIEAVRLNFSTKIIERVGTFAEIAEINYSDFLAETFRFNTP